MIPGNVYVLMAQYHLWMDERLYAVAEELSDEQRNSDRGAFFHSVHGTFNHLLLGNLRWMGRFLDRQLTDADIGDTLYHSFDDLRRKHLKQPLERLFSKAAGNEEVVGHQRLKTENWRLKAVG